MICGCGLFATELHVDVCSLAVVGVAPTPISLESLGQVRGKVRGYGWLQKKFSLRKVALPVDQNDQNPVLFNWLQTLFCAWID